MKKLLLYIAAITAVCCFAGCENNDNEPGYSTSGQTPGYGGSLTENTDGSLQGTIWHGQSFIDETRYFTLNFKTISEVILRETVYKGAAAGQTDIISGSYKIDGSEIAIELPVQTQEGMKYYIFPATVDGDTLLLHNPDGSVYGSFRRQ